MHKMSRTQRVKGVKLVDLLNNAQDNPQFRMAMRLFQKSDVKRINLRRNAPVFPKTVLRTACDSLPASPDVVVESDGGEDVDLIQYLTSVFVNGSVRVPRYVVWMNIGVLLLCVGMLAYHTRK